MLPSSLARILRTVRVKNRSRLAIHAMGVFILMVLVGLELVPFFTPRADAQSHTSPTVNENCQQVSFSSDGNPFPICPGPFPATGGNCVWWAWEQWHLLGYDLPLNWGNAADWAVDAERTGLPMGTTPRVGAIAVFPRADGVWAYGTPGHVAFVTSVSSNGMSFNVTYQNYGDPTPMYIGTNYNVSVINQQKFQNGGLRFIYFPQMINPALFMRLPGIGSTTLAEIAQTNHLYSTTIASSTGAHVTLGISSTADEQEFNADFTGDGHSDLLLYNRLQGQLDVLSLGTQQKGTTSQTAKMVSLGDATTPKGKWGSSLEIHVGDFNGSGQSQILLYDRSLGTIQILSLTPQLTIKKHVTLNGWGPDWEMYVGRFDGQRSGLFMYKRFAFAIPVSTTTGTNPTTGNTNSPTPVPTHPIVQPTKTTPKPTATPKPKVNPTATPKPNPTVTPSPTPDPSPTVTPSPTATPKPSPTPSPTPDPSPTVTPSPTATPKPAPTVTPSPTATPKSSPTVTPSPTVSPTPTKTTSPTPTVSPTSTATDKDKNKDKGRDQQATIAEPLSTPGVTNTDLSGVAPTGWEQQGRTANILLVDFDKNFHVHVQQQYTLWHANWEVYVGHFVSPTQDAIFLYDRLAGEGRLIDFKSDLTINDYQQLHNLDGNWMVSTGDFIGSGQTQLFLYDPQSGDAQMLAFNKHLQLINQRVYQNLGANNILYVGHFGMSRLSVMLYDPQSAKSTFIAFQKSLAMGQHMTVKSWGSRWQILIGAFVAPKNQAQCTGKCVPNDDILVLDRQTGQIGEYAFSFGQPFHVYDNRAQAFNRLGVNIDPRLNSVNTTTFSLLTTLKTSIKNEELY